ncbi:MAG TPA: carbohydrate kinase family protein [bacterium]|nr:carbohydrate kinase family protein [bacterium]
MNEKFDVICIGAALVDIVAQVDRHPLEDDEVFVSDLNFFSGGASANTAYACAKLGLKTAFLGMIGRDDSFSTKILKDFNEVNVSTSLIKYTSDHFTGSAYIALNHKGDRRIYAHSGAANYLSKTDILENEVSHTKVIFLSSLKNLDSFNEAAKIGRRKKITVILNPGMLIVDQGFIVIKELLKNVDILIMSKREFQVLFKVKDEINEVNVNNKANSFFELGIKFLVITMGRQGALIISPHNSESVSPIKIEKVLDTTGAGDAFSAGFIYGFIQNSGFNFDDIKQNAKLGNFVAGKCIEKLGARNGIPDTLNGKRR